MGQGDTSPKYLDRGDTVTNVPPIFEEYQLLTETFHDILIYVYVTSSASFVLSMQCALSVCMTRY